jgi:hypothetical protein
MSRILTQPQASPGMVSVGFIFETGLWFAIYIILVKTNHISIIYDKLKHQIKSSKQKVCGTH